jgi:hypothetical protein
MSFIVIWQSEQTLKFFITLTGANFGKDIIPKVTASFSLWWFILYASLRSVSDIAKGSFSLLELIFFIFANISPNLE